MVKFMVFRISLSLIHTCTLYDWTICTVFKSLPRRITGVWKSYGNELSNTDLYVCPLLGHMTLIYHGILTPQLVDLSDHRVQIYINCLSFFTCKQDILNHLIDSGNNCFKYNFSKRINEKWKLHVSCIHQLLVCRYDEVIWDRVWYLGRPLWSD